MPGSRNSMRPAKSHESLLEPTRCGLKRFAIRTADSHECLLDLGDDYHFGKPSVPKKKTEECDLQQKFLIRLYHKEKIILAQLHEMNRKWQSQPQTFEKFLRQMRKEELIGYFKYKYMIRKWEKYKMSHKDDDDMIGDDVGNSISDKPIHLIADAASRSLQGSESLNPKEDLESGSPDVDKMLDQPLVVITEIDSVSSKQSVEKTRPTDFNRSLTDSKKSRSYSTGSMKSYDHGTSANFRRLMRRGLFPGLFAKTDPASRSNSCGGTLEDHENSKCSRPSDCVPPDPRTAITRCEVKKNNLSLETVKESGSSTISVAVSPSQDTTSTRTGGNVELVDQIDEKSGKTPYDVNSKSDGNAYNPDLKSEEKTWVDGASEGKTQLDGRSEDKAYDLHGASEAKTQFVGRSEEKAQLDNGSEEKTELDRSEGKTQFDRSEEKKYDIDGASEQKICDIDGASEGKTQLHGRSEDKAYDLHGASEAKTQFVGRSKAQLDNGSEEKTELDRSEGKTQLDRSEEKKYDIDGASEQKTCDIDGASEGKTQFVGRSEEKAQLDNGSEEKTELDRSEGKTQLDRSEENKYDIDGGSEQKTCDIDGASEVKTLLNRSEDKTELDNGSEEKTKVDRSEEKTYDLHDESEAKTQLDGRSEEKTYDLHSTSEEKIQLNGRSEDVTSNVVPHFFDKNSEE